MKEESLGLLLLTPSPDEAVSSLLAWILRWSIKANCCAGFTAGSYFLFSFQNICETIAANQVTVISGETGCGKTTQVPQYILDEFIAKGRGSQCHIICTQPRRISAVTVSTLKGTAMSRASTKYLAHSVKLATHHNAFCISEGQEKYLRELSITRWGTSWEL
jgi:hypothetical protein